MKLSEAGAGKRVKIVAIATDSAVAAKLQNLGVREGAPITVLRFAPMGTPVEIKADNTRIAIGIAEADKITVEYVV